MLSLSKLDGLWPLSPFMRSLVLIGDTKGAGHHHLKVMGGTLAEV